MSGLIKRQSSIRQSKRFQLLALPSGDLQVVFNLDNGVTDDSKLAVILDYDQQSPAANPDDYLITWEFLSPTSIVFSRQNVGGDMRLSGIVIEYY